MDIRFRTRQRARWLLLVPVAAAALVACSGGGGGSGATTSATLNGVAVDGYIQGATVFLDLNGNKMLDGGEPNTVSDGSGRYSLSTAGIDPATLTGAKVIVTGGIDTDTGYAFTGRLSARVENASGGQVVTPLTTLVDAMVEQKLATDAASARTLIANALGLSASELSLDPMLYLDSKPGLYTTQVALQRAIQLLAAANATATEAPETAQARVIQALAATIKAQTGRVSTGALLAQLSMPQSAVAARLADNLHDALETALRDQGGGGDMSRAVLKSMDQLRVKAQNSGDYDLDKHASDLDRESGLSMSRPVSRLIDRDAGNDSQAITGLVQRTSSAGGTTYSQPGNTAGRLLASNCFQCHGTGGVGGFDNIRGGDAAEIREYLGKPANSDIMAAHAQGYTSAQLDAIIAYLQQR